MNTIRMILAVVACGLIFASVAFAGTAHVPEPTSLSLLVVGAVALYGLHRHRGRK
jgi:hypothetical protein